MITRIDHVFWRPNPAFITELCNYLHGKKVLEIFSGNGYLASILFKQGVEITSTSLRASHDGHQFGMHYPVIDMEASQAVEDFGEDADVLLLSWPTVTEAAINAVKLWGDKPIVYIGEITDYSRNELGGCATDSFFDNVKFTKFFESYKGNYIEKAAIGRLLYKAKGDT